MRYCARTVQRVTRQRKLASSSIEFAAGLAIDGDRVVVSFGVDDMECRKVCMAEDLLYGPKIIITAVLDS